MTTGTYETSRDAHLVLLTFGPTYKFAYASVVTKGRASPVS